MTEHPIPTSFENHNILVDLAAPRLPSAADFADAIIEQYRGEPVTGPVHVSVKCFLIPPKSLSKAQRAKRLGERMGSRSVHRLGNADILLTRTLRACEGTLWPDDGLVASAMVEMAWGAEEKTVIRVHPVDLDAVLPENF